MDSPSLTVALAMVGGILAQALSRHVRLPGIVLLLATGVLLGPDVANIVRPETLGEGLHAVVGFAVAVILFEGGLHMNVGRLRRQARSIRRLVTAGAVITAIGGAIAAKSFLAWDLRYSLLFGTLVIVTGPTVITPLVRRLRIRKNVATILEAEGIFIDAVGATLAVVALEALLVPSTGSVLYGVWDLALRLGVGVAVGGVGGGILGLGLRWRHVVPEGMENILSLSFAIAVFQVSNAIVHESGIAAAIVAGMVISHTQSHAFDEIVEFKEQLTVLLIATLFVLLAADVRTADVIALGIPGVLVVIFLMVVVRPAGVLFSTYGSALDWREKAFLCWLSPRGIVAAAVASLFAIRLGGSEGVELRAMVFLVIAVTVTVQGLTGGVVASALGLRRKSNVGYLILGANRLARLVAGKLADLGEEVLVIDANPDMCNVAEEQGLSVIYGNGLEDRTLLRAQADTKAACVALTPNETVNYLFAQRIQSSHRGARVYVGLESATSGVTAPMVDEIHAGLLFAGERELGAWVRRLLSDDAITEQWECSYPAKSDKGSFVDAPPRGLIPLVVTRGKRALLVDERLVLQQGDIVAVAVNMARRKEAHEWLRNAGCLPLSTLPPDDSQVALPRADSPPTGAEQPAEQKRPKTGG